MCSCWLISGSFRSNSHKRWWQNCELVASQTQNAQTECQEFRLGEKKKKDLGTPCPSPLPQPDQLFISLHHHVSQARTRLLMRFFPSKTVRRSPLWRITERKRFSPLVIFFFFFLPRSWRPCRPPAGSARCCGVRSAPPGEAGCASDSGRPWGWGGCLSACTPPARESIPNTHFSCPASAFQDPSIKR